MDKKQLKKLLAHPLFLVIFTILCLLSILSLRESSKKASVSKESIQKLEKSTELMEQAVAEKQDKLNEEQEALALEKIMRNELLQKKEGEIVIQIPDQEDEENVRSENMETKESGPAEEWEKLFFSAHQ